MHTISLDLETQAPSALVSLARTRLLNHPETAVENAALARALTRVGAILFALESDMEAKPNADEWLTLIRESGNAPSTGQPPPEAIPYSYRRLNAQPRRVLDVLAENGGELTAGEVQKRKWSGRTLGSLVRRCLIAEPDEANPTFRLLPLAFGLLLRGTQIPAHPKPGAYLVWGDWVSGALTDEEAAAMLFAIDGKHRDEWELIHIGTSTNTALDGVPGRAA